MKKKRTKLIIAFALTALVAYTVGAYIQFPPTSGKAAGEVRRAKLYTANIVEIDTDNVQERLQSDSVFRSQLTKRAILMQNQAKSLAELIRKSNEIVGGNDSLESSLNALNISYQSVLNSCKAIDAYVENLSILSNGGKVKGFEQIYNNALLGYYLVNSKSGIVDSFRDDVHKYMSESDNNDVLAALADNWTSYNYFSGLLNGNTASLYLRESQEQMIGNRNQEQLMGYRNQEQLMGSRNQEQLMGSRNQEQLNAP